MSTGVVATQMAIMFLFLFIGYGLTKRGHFSVDTSRDLSFVISNICCPSMLLAGIFNAPAMTGWELLEGGIASVIIYIILILIGMLMGPLLRVPKPERKFYQLMTIFNNMGFIGYPVVNAVIGPEGMGFAALFNLGFNLLLFTYGIVLLRQGQVRVNWKTFLNAGTLSALLAILLLLTRWTVPTPVVSCLSYMGNAMTFFASAIIGHSLARTSWKVVLENKKLYLFVALRYLLVPILLGLALKRVVSNELLLNVFVLLMAMPAANMPLMMAQEYDMETDTLTGGIVLSTVCSIVTITVVATVVRML